MQIYPTKATTLGWGDPGAPGSTQGRTYERNNIITITIDGRRLRVNKAAAPLFEGFLGDLLAQGYRIGKGTVDDWGYAHRWINLQGRPQVGRLSEHSNGTAVDINALTNPQGRPLREDFPPNVDALAAKWGLRWGAHFPTPDPMHFEVTVPPSQVAAIVARNRGPAGPAAPTAAAKPAGTAAQGAGTAPRAAGGTGKSSQAFTGPLGGVWRLLVEGLLVAGGVAAVVLGANRAAGGAPGRALTTGVKLAHA